MGTQHLDCLSASSKGTVDLPQYTKPSTSKSVQPLHSWYLHLIRANVWYANGVERHRSRFIL